jgi:NADH dehydrogenase
VTEAHRPTLVVTGADGYIGSAVVRRALDQSANVHALTRRPGARTSRPGVRRFAYDVAGAPPEDALVGATAVVHLAIDGAAFTAPSARDVNTEGTARLIDAARRQGVGRFVFVSSQSAATGATSGYAASKASTEALLTGAGDAIVRPGMVYGGLEQGLYGRLCALVKRARIVPVPRPSAPVQTIHVDDLALALVRLALGPARDRRLYQLGAERPMTFAGYLKAIARYRFGREIVIIPIPLWPMAALARAIGTVYQPARALSERLAGLAAVTAMDCADSISALGLDLRDPADALRLEAAAARES